MPHSRIGSRSAPSGRNDVIQLQRGDHERVLQDFQEFERLESLQASQACQRVVQRTFAELKVLADVEQQLFYPAVHDAIAGTDLIDQSQIEHARIQRTIAELEDVEPSEERYWRRFRTLGEYVRRHVADEEGELFPMLACVPIDWDRLYEEMAMRRAQLAEDLGVTYVPPLRHERAVAELEPIFYDEHDDELALEGQH